MTLFDEEKLNMDYIRKSGIILQHTERSSDKDEGSI